MGRPPSEKTLAARGLDRWGFPAARSGPPVSATPTHRFDHKVQPFLEGLRRMCKDQKPGQTFTRDEIAAQCEVTPDAIRFHEKRALRKMRERLGVAHGKQALDLLRSLCSNDDLRHIPRS